MSENNADITRPIPFNLLFLGIIAAITVFMIWCGVSNKPLPEWAYWITTLL